MASANEAHCEFARWYATSYPTVYACVLLACGSADDAEDAAQEAFSRALANWRRVRTMEKPLAWTARVAVNSTRRRARRSSLEHRLLAGAVQRAKTEHLDGESDDELWRAVQQLSPRQRTAIALRYIDDLPQREVASQMQIAPGTAAATLTKARRRLAGLLRKD